jgi:hypothetical protein
LIQIKVDGNKHRSKKNGKGRDGGFWKKEIQPSRKLDLLYEMMLIVFMSVPQGYYVIDNRYFSLEDAKEM